MRNVIISSYEDKKVKRAIQELLHTNDNKSTALSILSLYGKTFLRRISLRQYIGHKVPKLTVKKLHGKFFHSLFHHCADEHKLLTGNTENQERTLKFLKDITSSTSNHHPEQKFLNCVIISQATDKLNAYSPSAAID